MARSFGKAPTASITARSRGCADGKPAIFQGGLLSQMIPLGVWCLAEQDGLQLIVEVTEGAGFAYLWKPGTGVRSHVWLFNRGTAGSEARLSGEGADGEAPAAMPWANIIQERHAVPNTIDDLSGTVSQGGEVWTLSWAGREMAFLRPDAAPGASIFAAENHELAAAWKAAPDSSGGCA